MSLFAHESFAASCHLKCPRCGAILFFLAVSSYQRSVYKSHKCARCSEPKSFRPVHLWWLAKPSSRMFNSFYRFKMIATFCVFLFFQSIVFVQSSASAASWSPGTHGTHSVNFDYRLKFQFGCSILKLARARRPSEVRSGSELSDLAGDQRLQRHAARRLQRSKQNEVVFLRRPRP